MDKQEDQSQSRKMSPEHSNGTRLDGNTNTLPSTTEIDLEIDPLAYRYESWSDMADGWTDVLRSSTETMPDPEHGQIRNVTPLVPLADVEALVERVVVSEEVVIVHDRTNDTEDDFPSI